MIGAGVSLRLKACQILELVTGQAGGDSFGFQKEDGYEHKQEEADATFEQTSQKEDF